MLKLFTQAAIALMAGALLASPVAAHGSRHHHWRPYVIEKVCDYQWGHCDIRMDYDPGQHAGLAGSGSYWYQSARRHHRHHRHHAHHRGSHHVAWCQNHYRTYDRHSDTFIGRGYHRYRCISPY